MPEPKKRKLEVLGMSLDGASYDVARQTAWLLRSEVSVDDELWRPPRVYRVAAKSWLEKTDNQIKQSTVYKGWIVVQFKGGDLAWSDPYAYPRASIAIYNGGDGLCVGNAHTIATWCCFTIYPTS